MDIAITSILAAIAVLTASLVVVHLGFRAPKRIEQGTPADFGLSYQEIRIPATGGKRLFAWWLTVGPSTPTVILLHGWGGNAEFMLPLALPLHNVGMNVLLLDARNHGRSDSASFSSLPRFAEDVGSAIDWVKGQNGNPPGPVVLLGHSVGAGAVLFEASRRHDVAAVISVAAFAHPEWMMRRHLARFKVPNPLTAWILRYVEWVIGHHFDQIAPLKTACQVKCPVLLVHGKADQTVPVTDALKIQENCKKSSLELLLIEGAGHDSVDKVEEHEEQLIVFLKRAGVLC